MIGKQGAFPYTSNEKKTAACDKATDVKDAKILVFGNTRKDQIDSSFFKADDFYDIANKKYSDLYTTTKDIFQWELGGQLEYDGFKEKKTDESRESYLTYKTTELLDRGLATFYYGGKRTIKNYAIIQIIRDLFAENTDIIDSTRSAKVFVEEFWGKELGITITAWLNADQTPKAVD